MTSREDLGRLAYAAHCDMAGRACWPWDSLPDREQAAWMHAAVAVRDRLTLGMSHAYRPEERSPEMALPKSNANGGSDEPTINATDDADLYARLRAEGRDDVEWTGDGPAPGSDAEPAPEAEQPADEAPKPRRSARAKNGDGK